MKSKENERVGIITLEYINGVQLNDTAIGNLCVKDKYTIVKQILNRIQAAHAQGIIHRDINPTNIMVLNHNQVKVIDFGICKIKSMVSKETTYHLATAGYAAPEATAHSEKATVQSDLYSIGAVIYFLFTGKKPPIASQFSQVLNKETGFDFRLKEI